MRSSEGGEAWRNAKTKQTPLPRNWPDLPEIDPKRGGFQVFFVFVCVFVCVWKESLLP